MDSVRVPIWLTLRRRALQDFFWMASEMRIGLLTVRSSLDGFGGWVSDGGDRGFFFFFFFFTERGKKRTRRFECQCPW